MASVEIYENDVNGEGGVGGGGSEGSRGREGVKWQGGDKIVKKEG